MLESLLQLSLTSQALLVAIGVGLVVFRIFKKRYHLPPGPTEWPIFGNIGFGKDLLFKTLHEWSKTYGPVMKIKLGTTPVVVLSTKDAVLEALLKKPTDFAGRARTPFFDWFTEKGNDLVFATYGPRWKLHRKLASKAIRNYMMGDQLNRKASRSLVIMVNQMKKETDQFDPLPFITLLVFNFLFSVCFDKKSSGTNDERFMKLIANFELATEEVGTGFLEDIVPLLRFFPTSRYRRTIKASTEVKDEIKKQCDEHKQSFMKGVTRDFCDAMIAAQKEAEQEEDSELLSQITDKHIRLTMVDMFFAGIGTTRTTLHWCILALALYPEVQKKIQEEVDSVLDQDLSLNVADRDRLSYTEAVLHEVMRLRPALPLGAAHEAMIDSTVGGYDIPKGTTVMINHYALHYDTDQWEDVFAFRPERFLEPSGKMAPKPESWLPFGAGRRVCLGEAVAKPELHLFLAGICRAFTVELAPGTSHDFQFKGSGVISDPGRYKIVVKTRI